MSLKEICKKRILEEIIGAGRGLDDKKTTSGNGDILDDYYVMITDSKTLKIISSCCKNYDIIQNGVTVVELIHKKRQRLSSIDAIYFISASNKSVDFLLNDFVNEKSPQYANAHIFFSSHIDTSLMELIAECQTLVPRIKSLVEFNLNFIPYESRVFHLGETSILTKLFPLEQPELLYQMADQLLSFCLTLSILPSVRYKKNKFDLSQQLARILHRKLKIALSEKITENETIEDEILILDRSIDIATIFAHEYTYQALAYDVLNIPCCSDESFNNNQAYSSKADDMFEHVVINNSGEQENKMAFLGEDDNLWIRFRHEHIQDVNNLVEQEVRKFVNENEAAKITSNKKRTTEDTMKAIRAIPKYQEMLSKYWVHVTISEKCFQELKTRNLMQVGSLEQDICCGVDKCGKEINPSKLLSNLGANFSNDQIGTEEKLRLLLLYLSQMDGISEMDCRKLLEESQLSLDYQRLVLKFLKMEFHSPEESASPIPLGKHEKKMSRDKNRLAYFKNRAKSAKFELSRFEPLIKEIFLNLVHKTLNQEQYPYVQEIKKEFSKHNTLSSLNASSISRTTEWCWGDLTDLNPSASSDSLNKKELLSSLSKNEKEKCRRRLIIFVIGGITFAEMRCTYEIANQFDVDVYLGGTSIITAKQFINILRKETFYENKASIKT